jgi:hypothetical protein
MTLAEGKRGKFDAQRGRPWAASSLSALFLLATITDAFCETVLCPGPPPIQIREGDQWKQLLGGSIKKVEIRAFSNGDWSVICFQADGTAGIPRKKACRFVSGTRISKGQVANLLIDLTICEMTSRADNNATECAVTCDD